MALDRQSIEKRDFPIGRRGYEPEAVDEHLARVAAEVEDLRRSTSPGGGSTRSSPASIAQAASEQVRSIVEAAESSAADIERAAQDAADRIQAEAEADARATRDDAVAQSQAHVGQVRAVTAQMLQRVDAMESELTGLIESLRTGANRLTTDLSLLETGMADLYDAAGRERGGAAPVIESVPAVVLRDEPPALAEPAGEPAQEVEEAAEVAAAPEPRPHAADGDIEGARLVALNMALNGTSRDETDRYLAENFDISDRAALLDEVYSTVES